jgi:hypothetical protein
VTDKLPPPQRIRHDVGLVAVQIRSSLDRYSEAYDAALSRTQSGGLISTSAHGRSAFEEKDPAGETAVVSWDPRHVRSAARYAVAALRRATRELENANARLHDAFLDTDPDLKTERLAKRQAATEGMTRPRVL